MKSIIKYGVVIPFAASAPLLTLIYIIESREADRIGYLDRNNCIEISRTSQKYEYDKVTYKCEVKDKP